MSSNDPEATSTTTADPFTAFLAARDRALATAEDRTRYNAGEHVWLGTQGAELARIQLAREQGITVDKGVFRSIRRLHGNDVLDYGEIVALSGDFYGSPEELYEERPAALPWLWEDNDLSDLRELFDAELSWIEERHKRNRGPYPDNNIRLAWNAKSYVELALQNVDHFGWHNIQRYCRHHAEALQLAYDAHGRENEAFRRALYVNAFADHFLTDAFAAGHIRVPRAEIIAWARKAGVNDRIAGALSKLLHDQDGHIDLRSLHGRADGSRADDDGLLVQNAMGATWRTRCDGQLFLDPGAAGSPAVSAPVAAVAASVTELVLAWARGELPEGVYRATEYVPFPHPSAPKLIEKFPADLSAASREELWKSVAWYTKLPWIGGLEIDHISRLFGALPAIMTEFRASIALAADRDPLVAGRVSPRYIAAFRGIA